MLLIVQGTEISFSTSKALFKGAMCTIWLEFQVITLLTEFDKHKL